MWPRRVCVVPGCTEYYDVGVVLHSFPASQPELCQKWKDLLNIDYPLKKWMCVCSKHFGREDYFPVPNYLATGSKRLKIGTVPSKKLPQGKALSRRKKAKQNKQQCPVKLEYIPKEEENDLPQQVTDNVNNSVASLKKYDKNMVKFAEKLINYPTKLLALDTSLRGESNENEVCNNFKLPRILNTNEKLFQFTGINYDILSKYQISLRNTIERNISEEYDLKNVELQLVLALCKLKQNITFECLAVLFSISEETCRHVFYSVISLLAGAVKPAIYWPAKQEILEDMPDCFKKYENTRVVLDFLEVEIEHCKITMNSRFDKVNTIKYLIGITPSGYVSYLSQGYEGESMPETIFNKERIIEKLNPDDAIMVDSEIDIEKECKKRRISVIKPPFLNKQLQSAQNFMGEMMNIARARVHVERAIQRINTFRILKVRLEWDLLPYIDDIVTVIIATANLSSSIFIDDNCKNKSFELYKNSKK